METMDQATPPQSKVLVVEDNPQHLELLSTYLGDLPNVTVVQATNGLEALDKVARESPDLILLDIMMPKMSGFEVCKQLKSDPQTRHIPIIMVTALREVADIERAVESGCDDFVCKPVTRIEVTTRVKSLLRVRHLKNQLERTMAYLSQIEADRTQQAPGP